MCVPVRIFTGNASKTLMVMCQFRKLENAVQVGIEALRVRLAEQSQGSYPCQRSSTLRPATLLKHWWRCTGFVNPREQFNSVVELYSRVAD